MQTKEQIMQQLEKIKMEITVQLKETCSEKQSLTTMKEKIPSMVYLVDFQINYLMQEVDKVVVALKLLQNDDTASLESAIAVLTQKNLVQSAMANMNTIH